MAYCFNLLDLHLREFELKMFIVPFAFMFSNIFPHFSLFLTERGERLGGTEEKGEKGNVR